MRQRSSCVSISLCLIVLLALGPAFARDHYVSPVGSPAGEATEASPLDLFTVLSADSPARPGDTLRLMAGQYDGKMNGLQRIPITVAVSGEKGKVIRVMPARGAAVHINGSIVVTSSYVHFIGLEIGDLKWDPWGKTHRAQTVVNVLSGRGAKFINCNIFGGAMGTGLWQPAVDLEFYGCLVHDFGYLEETGRGHGHAFYAQNKEGTKTLKRNIAWRGCGWNVHIYTQGSSIDGFDIIENICYVAGSRKPGQTMDNFLVSGYPPADRIRLIGNVAYQPSDVEGWRPDARLSAYKDVENGTAVVRDNYLMGAFYGLSLGRWKKIEVTGNTIWATGIFMEICSAPTGSGIGRVEAKPDLAGYAIDRNTYYENGKDKPFKWGRNEGIVAADLYGFADWQQLGLDRNGKVVAGKDGRPTGIRVFVFPNEYEPGRTHVGVFNWDGLKEVEVDLSRVLAKGQHYRVYNCLDISQTLARAKPAMTGVFDGRPVLLPMRAYRISLHFDAFLVLPAER